MNDNNTATTTTTTTTSTPAVKPLPSIPDYGENAIEITNLTFSYRATDSSSSYTNSSTNNPENVVLQDMNLSLPTGSRCLLIGANGSGKSVRSYLCVNVCACACACEKFQSSIHLSLMIPHTHFFIFLPSLHYTLYRHYYGFWRDGI
jgi:ABC-type glutathione transport system ATPase component